MIRSPAKSTAKSWPPDTTMSRAPMPFTVSSLKTDGSFVLKETSWSPLAAYIRPAGPLAMPRASVIELIVCSVAVPTGSAGSNSTTPFCSVKNMLPLCPRAPSPTSSSSGTSYFLTLPLGFTRATVSLRPPIETQALPCASVARYSGVSPRFLISELGAACATAGAIASSARVMEAVFSLNFMHSILPANFGPSGHPRGETRDPPPSIERLGRLGRRPRRERARAQPRAGASASRRRRASPRRRP